MPSTKYKSIFTEVKKAASLLSRVNDLERKLEVLKQQIKIKDQQLEEWQAKVNETVGL
jgi:chaperonin cofactor prefoldin